MLWLQNTNKKPLAGSRTHWSASLHGHQKRPKRGADIVSLPSGRYLVEVRVSVGVRV